MITTNLPNIFTLRQRRREEEKETKRRKEREKEAKEEREGEKEKKEMVSWVCIGRVRLKGEGVG